MNCVPAQIPEFSPNQGDVAGIPMLLVIGWWAFMLFHRERRRQKKDTRHGTMPGVFVVEVRRFELLTF